MVEENVAVHTTREPDVLVLAQEPQRSEPIAHAIRAPFQVPRRSAASLPRRARHRPRLGIRRRDRCIRRAFFQKHIHHTLCLFTQYIDVWL